MAVICDSNSCKKSRKRGIMVIGSRRAALTLDAGSTRNYKWNLDLCDGCVYTLRNRLNVAVIEFVTGMKPKGAEAKKRGKEY